jgi:hypothetical protein
VDTKLYENKPNTNYFFQTETKTGSVVNPSDQFIPGPYRSFLRNMSFIVNPD